jgi:hypothetical protein
MSNAAEEVEEADENNKVCANCGVAEVDDDIQLEDCDRCDLVKYCSDKCKEEHREQHAEECKKRKAKLHDKKIFTQPNGSHLGECPICFLPMPLDPPKTTFKSCCSKIICCGCEYSNFMSDGSNKCPFCREPAPDDEERHERMMKRIKANDPAAMREVGAMKRYDEGDYVTAFNYLSKAAELGDADAHCQLGYMHQKGEGVKKDGGKAVYHSEKAAIGGHPIARHNLACVENENGNTGRAVKHFIIAANLGYEKSMRALWEYYKDGNITKEDLDATLRTHHASINEMKSPQREAAQVWRERQRGARRRN